MVLLQEAIHTDGSSIVRGSYDAIPYASIVNA
jgi:hypothetical protein